jgi:short subunit dehydrogenase-like uncharacterized protein
VSTSRVLLFGATGYTGRLTAEAMLRRGLAPLLVGRSPRRLAEVATALGGHPPTAVADADDPAALADLLREGDVLVTTVGPFTQHGRTAATAALEAGATYLDSTGEAGFLRWMFEQLGPRAERAGVSLVPAFGYDYLPGNLAAALALREAGDAASRVDVGYFVTGGRAALSGGTLASAVGISSDASFGWRSGRLVTERTAARVRSFAIPGGQRQAVSIGGTEQLALPRSASGLREVNVYLGWVGPLARPAQVLSLVASGVVRIPGAPGALSWVGRRLAPGSTGGPDAGTRAKTRSRVVAEAFDHGGQRLARVDLDGPDPYGLTAELLAWGAQRAAAGRIVGSGVVGPVEAFGLDRLAAGAAEVGLRPAAAPAAP